MTTATVTDFVLTLYENEVRRVVGEVVKTIVDKYDLNKADVDATITDTLNFELSLATPSETFVIKRKYPREKKVKVERPQCCALTLKQKQCSRRCVTMNDLFCTVHLEQQKYGYIQ